MLHRPTGRVNKPAKVASAGPQRSVKELILWGSERWMLRSCRERKKTLIEGKGKKKKHTDMRLKFCNLAQNPWVCLWPEIKIGGLLEGRSEI